MDKEPKKRTEMDQNGPYLAKSGSQSTNGIKNRPKRFPKDCPCPNLI